MRNNVGAAVIGFAAGVIAGGLLFSRLAPNPHAWMLIGVMVAGGLLGGAVNYLLTRADDEQRASLLMSLFAGLGAALLVPLFLNMLSSDLLRESKDEPLSVLVFLGFCLIAAISSRAFISTLSDRLLRQVREATEEAREARAEAQEAKDETAQVRSEVATIVERETEPEVEAAAAAPAAESSLVNLSEQVDLSEDEVMILRALAGGRYVNRSRSGLHKETGLGAGRVRVTLDSLVERGLAGAKASRKDGLPRWFITDEGMRALNLFGSAAR